MNKTKEKCEHEEDIHGNCYKCGADVLSKEQTFEERFEDQSFIRVMKDASDFHRAQYDLLKKIAFSFSKTEVSELLGDLVPDDDESWGGGARGAGFREGWHKCRIEILKRVALTKQRFGI